MRTQSQYLNQRSLRFQGCTCPLPVLILLDKNWFIKSESRRASRCFDSNGDHKFTFWKYCGCLVKRCCEYAIRPDVDCTFEKNISRIRVNSDCTLYRPTSNFYW